MQVGGGAELRLGVNNLLDALRNLLTNLQPVANVGNMTILIVTQICRDLEQGRRHDYYWSRVVGQGQLC